MPFVVPYSLRQDPTGAIHEFLSPDHQLRCKVVVLADVLEQLLSRIPEKEEPAGPWRRIRAGIIDRDLVLHGVGVGAREPFSQVQLFGGWKSVAVEPEILMEPYSVHDQRVAFPAADRMAVVTGNEMLRVRTATQMTRPEGGRGAHAESED